ncbi:hypothetical protein ACIHFE_33065 [Streptomyces sp. NPDC052396]|uniref:hypothetical protein n=1 Tax=Streptomyces sp. NPDC052396 TaxID=3365689 RepID=UPI0037D033D3
MDFDSVADELYRLPPDEFTAARTKHAAAAREAGLRDLARRIDALHRPTLSAWTANQLVRRHPDQVRKLTGLGDDLRRAHREPSSRQTDNITDQQRAVVAELIQHARRIVEETGHPFTGEVEDGLEQTLRAAATDDQAARDWVAGRLAEPLTAPASFPGAQGTPHRSVQPHGRPKPLTTEAGSSRSQRQTQRDRHDQQARARQEAREAQRDARAHEKELGLLRRRAGQAERTLHRTDQRVRELTQQLEQARQHHQAAQEELQQTRDRLNAAERAMERTREQAGDAGHRTEE